LSDSTPISIIKEVVSLKDRPQARHRPCDLAGVTREKAPIPPHADVPFLGSARSHPASLLALSVVVCLQVQRLNHLKVWCRFDESMTPAFPNFPCVSHSSSSPSASQASVYPTFPIGSEDFSRNLRGNMNLSPACTMLLI
jgi:hypothetical protein